MCFVRDEYRVRLRQRLKTRREVRCLADRRILLCNALADEIAYDNDAGGNADARLNTHGLRLTHTVDDCERGAHCSFRVVFVRGGVAEVSEHTVAEKLCDSP